MDGISICNCISLDVNIYLYIVVIISDVHVLLSDTHISIWGKSW
jgi:hypothetical protein